MLKTIRLMNKSALITIKVNVNEIVDGNNLKPILFKSKKINFIKSKILSKLKLILILEL